MWLAGQTAPSPGITIVKGLFQIAAARPADRTAYDECIISHVRGREPTEAFIDSQGEVGGYPEFEENTHSLRIPDENLRNWLQWHALAVEDSDISQ